MGRSYSEVRVTRVDDRVFAIGRTRDPDDEFATDQLLTKDGWEDDDEAVWSTDLITAPTTFEANRLLDLYRLGWDAAVDAAGVVFR